MKNTKTESLSEHTLETAYIAHALAVITNERFSGNCNPSEIALYALYHDATEAVTGDLPTPVKYYNDSIRNAYHHIESEAADRMMSRLPQDLQGGFSRYVRQEYPDTLTRDIVKAADKLSALRKCIDEVNSGNLDFTNAMKNTQKAVDLLTLPCVKVFTDEFLEAYSLTIDELNC